jgi:glycerophosphoryl diester phosphodiesterase
MRASDFAYFDAPFLALAHRGGAEYGPNQHRENTAHAFGQAVALGYTYLETDVHATADGVLLAFHDNKLDRVTDRQGLIAALPYAQIREARIGGHDPIPTLAELLVAFPQARFNIDAKSESAVELLADTIAEHEAYDRVCVSSFGIKRLHRLRRRLGDRVPSAASMAGVAWTRFAPWLTAALNTAGVALQMPIHHRIRGRDILVLTEALVTAAHRAGKQVHIWTVDDSESMEKLIDAGVDGIFTDRIDTLKAVLQHRSLWSPPTQ